MKLMFYIEFFLKHRIRKKKLRKNNTIIIDLRFRGDSLH